MLTKITNDFYINLDEIVFVAKIGKDIEIKMLNDPKRLTLSVYSTEGKEFIKVIDKYQLSGLEERGNGSDTEGGS